MKRIIRKPHTLSLKRETLRQLDKMQVAGAGVEEPPTNSLCGSHCFGLLCVQK